MLVNNCCKMAAILVILLVALTIGGIEAAGEKSEKYCDDVYLKTFSLNNPTTVIEEFPYMAALGYEDAEDKQIVFGCAGILISEQYILTTAHCLLSRINGVPVQVKLGLSNLNATNNDGIIQTIDVSKLILHPDYKNTSKYNDVGLVELKQSVKFTKDVKPVCLENKKKLSYPSLITASLGIIHFIGEPRRTLKRFKIVEFDNAECRKYYKKAHNLKEGILADSLICAGNRQEDPCVESGNPLIDIDPDYGHRVVGLTSFGKICGLLNVPTVFYRVSHYIGWIESIVWP